jgi:hypothetical protein
MSNVKLYGNYTNGESQPVTVPKVVAIHSQPNAPLERTAVAGTLDGVVGNSGGDE